MELRKETPPPLESDDIDKVGIFALCVKTG